MRKKIFIFTSLTLSILIFLALWNVVSGGYDRQNKIILLLKKIIPSSVSHKVRDTVFIIPDLKEENKILNLQVQKYEQGMQGKKFKDTIVVSDKKKTKFNLKEFFLPFPRLDLRLGWAATENSRRAHYLEIVKDKVLVISGLGQTIFFEKQNIFKDKLLQKEIPNNIIEILKENEAELLKKIKFISLCNIKIKKDLQ